MSSHDPATSRSRSARPRTRRAFLGASGLALATALAGCSGRVVTGGNVSFEAAPAAVASGVLDDTGYERYDRSEEVVTREYSVAGVSREVRVTNVVTQYDRALDLGALGRYQAGVFAVVSSPQVRFLWETFNPLGEMTTDEVAAWVDDRYENVRNVSRDRTYQVPMLGADETVTRYTGEALLVDGEVAVDVYLYVSDVVRAGEDFVVAVGAHPQLLDDSGAMLELVEGVEHGG